MQIYIYIYFIYIYSRSLNFVSLLRKCPCLSIFDAYVWSINLDHREDWGQRRYRHRLARSYRLMREKGPFSLWPILGWCSPHPHPLPPTTANNCTQEWPVGDREKIPHQSMYNIHNLCCTWRILENIRFQKKKPSSRKIL